MRDRLRTTDYKHERNTRLHKLLNDVTEMEKGKRRLVQYTKKDID